MATEPQNGAVVTVTASGNPFDGAVGRVTGEPMSDGSLYVQMVGGVGAAFYPHALDTRIPTDLFTLAQLIRDDNETDSPMYDQLRQQCGADEAASLWRSACDLLDTMASDVEDDN